MKRLLFLAIILLLGSLCPGHADTPPDPQTPPVADPAQVSDHLREVLSRPEYQETVEADIGSRLKDSLSQWFLHLGAKFGQFQYSGEMPAFASLLMTLLVILSVAGLLYVMIRLTRRRTRMEMDVILPEPGPRAFRPPEYYDEEIKRAIGEHDWHRAWLASWRQFLSRLENRHLVEADRTRTNREYLAQLQAKSLPTPTLGLLIKMVDIYDRTIYGRKTISEPDWTQFRREIEETSLLLNLEGKSSAHARHE